MSDYSEFKTAATRIIEVHTSQDVPISKLFDKFDALASPESVLALITENERYLKLVERMVDQYVPLTELEGVPGWSRVVELVEVVAERDRLKTEVEGLRAQHGRDSAELRSLSQARDDARKERDRLKAEVERLTTDNSSLRGSCAKLGVEHAGMVRIHRKANTEIRRLSAEVEALRNLARELRGSAECINVHHCKSEQHDLDEPCKVLARIDAAMSKGDQP